MDVGSKEETYGEEGVDDVCLYRAERFVSDHNEDLLLLLQVDEVTEPRLLSQSEGTKTDRDHDWFQNISSTCSHQYTSDNLFYLDKNWQNMDRSWSHYFFCMFLDYTWTIRIRNILLTRGRNWTVTALLTLEKSLELDWTCPPGWELWILKFRVTSVRFDVFVVDISYINL